VIRVAAVLGTVVAAAGWITYVHVWRYGGTRPLPYRLETLRHFQPHQPETRLWISGDKEYALITPGPRSSTGFSLEIERAVVERSRVSIVVREIDKPGRPELTYPYRLLVFPWPHKPVHVHWEGRS
jgi:hypothetical protein